MSAREGKRWNNERREWVVENLEEESASMPADDEDILTAARERAKAADAAASRGQRHVPWPERRGLEPGDGAGRDGEEEEVRVGAAALF